MIYRMQPNLNNYLELNRKQSILQSKNNQCRKTGIVLLQYLKA